MANFENFPPGDQGSLNPTGLLQFNALKGEAPGGRTMPLNARLGD